MKNALLYGSEYNTKLAEFHKEVHFHKIYSSDIDNKDFSVDIHLLTSCHVERRLKDTSTAIPSSCCMK